MKRICFFLVTAALCTAPVLRAQDAATQERMDKMAGQIANLIENQDALRKKVEDLEKAIEHLRAQMDKPSGNYASQDYVKQLYESVKELDRKRVDDNEKLKADMKVEFRKLRDLITTTTVTPRTSSPAPTTTADDARGKKAGAVADGKGYEHVVKYGELLSTIVKAYRDEKKTTCNLEQVQKANPGLNPNKISVGQTIFIPASPP
jgi:septal ring factor EnvC (AmiA/AmiB activator)